MSESKDTESMDTKDSSVKKKSERKRERERVTTNAVVRNIGDTYGILSFGISWFTMNFFPEKRAAPLGDTPPTERGQSHLSQKWPQRVRKCLLPFYLCLSGSVNQFFERPCSPIK